MELKIGDNAPELGIPACGGGFADGQVVKLSDFAGKNLVVYFYPKDNTPGCTNEAIDFESLSADFAASNTVIVGISKDSIKSHKNFAEKFALKFTLASDEEAKICMAYGIWKEKSNYGKKYMGIERSTFLIDSQGKIAKIWANVKVEDHAKQVLEAAKNL